MAGLEKEDLPRIALLGVRHVKEALKKVLFSPSS
jgi:hypothetical protein